MIKNFMRYFNSQKKLNCRHCSWVKYSQAYLFVMKHKYGVENNVVDALGHQIMFLFVMSVQVTRFDRLKKEYELCLEFKETYIALRDGHLPIINDYYL